jgi:hypothetical protein
MPERCYGPPGTRTMNGPKNRMSWVYPLNGARNPGQAPACNRESRRGMDGCGNAAEKPEERTAVGAIEDGPVSRRRYRPRLPLFITSAESA